MHHPKRVILRSVIYVVIEPAINKTPNPSFCQPEEIKAVENLEGAMEQFFALYEELALDITDRERVRIMGEINARSNG